MSAGGDSSDIEPRLALENLPNSIDLVLQSSPLASNEPGERLDSHLNLAAGASLVPDASNYAVDEQDWIVACLARWRERTRGGPAREEPGSRVATNGVCVEVRQQQDAAFGVLTTRHLGVATGHPCRRPVEVDLGQLTTVPFELLSRPGSRGTDPLGKCCGVAGPYAYK